MDTPLRSDLHTDSYTASSNAYQQLKALLLLGEVPIGLRLREERLAERLEMSRTPVREALLRLHAEHFVDRHPEGGYRATNPSAQTMRELYEIRQALELCALHRLGPDAERNQDLVQELREEWQSLYNSEIDPHAEFVLLDEDFHRQLAESTGSVQLVEQLRQINERIRPIRSHDFMTPGRITATIHQHIEILDAVLAETIDHADHLLVRHIGESQAVVERAVATVLERMLSVGERDSQW